MKYLNKMLLAATCSGILSAASTPAFAETDASDEIIVTGTRIVGLQAEDSLAPVQILDATTLARDPSGALTNSLANALPSLNIQAVGFDLANETLSVRMRGLSPNHTLVLINGKRLHGTANLAVLSGPFQGGAAPDLNFVPLLSVRRVEVLQDGAAAQYGSDAIAGVLNIILDSASSGVSATISHGGYYRGDGITNELAVNFGHQLGEAGYLNSTIVIRDHGHSNAGGPDQRVERAISSGEHPEYSELAGYPLVNKVFGDARYRTYLATINAGISIPSGGEVYAFGTYGHKKAGGWANFRLPTRLPTLYPNGFSPIDWVIADDLSMTAGLRTSIGDWSLDLSSTYSFNHNRVEVTGSANADLYADIGVTPLDFYNGNLDNSQWVVNVDAQRSLDIGLRTLATLALGGEYRRETYSITEGDPASRYKAGSQSFPGFSLTDAGTSRRSVKAAYADLAFAPLRTLEVDLAGRYEHYSDFGDALVGKASGRLQVASALALRSTFSTGFRAPTLAEGRYSATNVQPNSAFVQLPPNSLAARLIGIEPLRPENSTNLNFGVVTELAGTLSFSLDFYQIKIRNRVVGSGTLYGTYAGSLRSAAVNEAIIANGNILEAVPFSGINIFSNGVDTRSRGVDLLVGLRTPVWGGVIDWSLAANYNDVEVSRIRDTPEELAASGQQMFDLVAISTLENASPSLKLVLAGDYSAGPIEISFRNTLYGQASRYADPGDGRYYIDRTGTKVITDLSVLYRLSERLSVSAGANNLFNVFPNRVNIQGLAASAAAGNPAVEIYPSFSPFGVNGGYYFGRIRLEI